MQLTSEEIKRAVQGALAEDIGPGDATTLALVAEDKKAKAAIVAREPLVVAGLAFAIEAFGQLDPEMKGRNRVKDGTPAEAGAVLLELEGSARALLTAERTALNFVQRLSGIATLARKYVETIEGSNAKILDTRKTTPGWRRFEKYAVECGGARNHRLGLFDQILIKDNHLAALREAKPNPIAAAIERARAAYPELKVEVEADDLAQVAQAAEAGADIILLDNMDSERLRAAVQIVARRCQIEASGGVTLQRVRAIAETGVDFISSGALTHSARAVDLALDFL